MPDCATLTFYCELGKPDVNRVKYTGFFSPESITGDWFQFGWNNQWFDMVIEWQNRVSEQTGNVALNALQRYLVNRRLLIERTEILISATERPTNIFKNLYLHLYHAGVAGYEQRALSFYATEQSEASNFLYAYNKSAFWMQKGFTFYLNYDAPNGVFDAYPIMVRFHVSKIDTYANPESIYETECKKVPFDLTMPIPVNS